jgi:hypothetical protein
MFTCKRCDCKFTRKSVLISHLKKKKICNPESDLDRSVLIEELAEPIQENGNYSCDFCSKKFNHLSNKCKHKHICKKNPNNLKNQKVQKLEVELKKIKEQISKIKINNLPQKNIEKKCEHDGCSVKPSFGNRGYKATHCIYHKLDGMENIFIENYKECNKLIEQEDKLHKIKEQHVMEVVKNVADEKRLKVIYDKHVKNGFSSRRPDALIDLGTHSIIIECDENQHKNYDNICEEKRILELFQDLGDRPIIFIRFNPDSYTSASGQYHKSCFSRIIKEQLPMVYNMKEWIKRCEMLRSRILYFIDQALSNNYPTENFIIEYLFFDGHI